VEMGKLRLSTTCYQDLKNWTMGLNGVIHPDAHSNLVFLQERISKLH
jgi:hypothetical protein